MGWVDGHCRAPGKGDRLGEMKTARRGRAVGGYFMRSVFTTPPLVEEFPGTATPLGFLFI